MSKKWDFSDNKLYFPKFSSNLKNTFQKVLKKYEAPIFVVDTKIIEDRYKKMMRALNSEWGKGMIAYSVKTNYDIAKHKQLKKLGASVDVVSQMEYDLVKKVGYTTDKILLNGPFKTDKLIKEAVKDGVLIHVYNQQELSRIGEVAKRLKKKTKIGIRLSTKVKGVGKSRFGFSIDNGDAKNAVQSILDNAFLHLSSIHHHNVADTFDPSSFADAGKKIANFLTTSVPNYSDLIETIDIGGGFPANRPKPFYRNKWKLYEINEYIRASAQELNKIFPKGKKPTMIVEPGRYLVDDAVYFVCQAFLVEKSGESQIINTDATLSMLPLADYCPQIIYPFSNGLVKKTSNLLETVIYGATSREDDLLYKGKFPATANGDFLIFYSTGAYNLNMGAEFIYEKPKSVFTT